MKIKTKTVINITENYGSKGTNVKGDKSGSVWNLKIRGIKRKWDILRIRNPPNSVSYDDIRSEISKFANVKSDFWNEKLTGKNHPFL